MKMTPFFLYLWLFAGKLVFSVAVGYESNKFKTRSLSLSAISWNLAEKSPTQQDCEIIRNQTTSNIVVFGVQELENVKPRRNEGHRSVEWKKLQAKLFENSNYVCLASHKLGGMHLTIFIDRDNIEMVEGAQILEIRCGMGNLVSNKGAVAVLLRLNNKTLALLNGHFAAQRNKVAERNSDYSRIMSHLRKNANPIWLRRRKLNKQTQALAEPVLSGENERIRLKKGGMKKSTGKRKQASKKRDAAGNIHELLDAIIFMGDFNYRVNTPRHEMELFHERYKKHMKCVKYKQDPLLRYDCRYDIAENDAESEKLKEALAELQETDQLLQEKRKGNVFQGFQEGEILFPPTFKYNVRSNRFDSSSKARCPAWTDRILFSSADAPAVKEGKTQVVDPATSDHSSDAPTIKLLEYKSIDVRSSDHRPVCAKFLLNF